MGGNWHPLNFSLNIQTFHRQHRQLSPTVAGGLRPTREGQCSGCPGIRGSAGGGRGHTEPDGCCGADCRNGEGPCFLGGGGRSGPSEAEEEDRRPALASHLAQRIQPRPPRIRGGLSSTSLESAPCEGTIRCSPKKLIKYIYCLYAYIYCHRRRNTDSDTVLGML